MALARRILGGLEQWLRSHAGLELPTWVIESRATARINALGVAPEGYLELITSPEGASERAVLLEAVRVGETRFFRHRPQVDALLEVVVPAWRERGEQNPRIWSAGCASGEEAYTLALVLARALPRPGFGPSILATDVSAEAIAFAKRGVYPASALEHVPEPWREGLLPAGAGMRVDPQIAALVTFRQHNLADAELPRGFDLVWCRNVLIYFAPAARAIALEKLVSTLEPGGFLFVGYSETLRDVAGLRAIRLADQVVWQKPRAPVASAPAVASARGGPEERQGRQGAKAPGERREGLIGRTQRPARTNSSPSSGALASWRLGVPPDPDPRTRVLRVTTTDAATLSAELGAALHTPGLSALTIDLDTATYLEDDVAPVLRRACAVARTAGIELSLRATRPGARRWLRRNGFDEGGT